MSLRRRVDAELQAAGLAPLHRYGQNFMIDEGALDRLLAELDLTPGARVAEIGPGTGLLTERLLAAGATVLAVEIDRGLTAILQERLVPRGLALVHGDALADKNHLHPALVDFARAGPWRLGANLPYDIALPALLTAAALPVGDEGEPRPQAPERVVVTVQWEAAQRLCSRPGADAWGASAAVLQSAGKPTIVRRLSPNSFYPQPRIDSAILRWDRERSLPPGFGRWCRAVFAARRKVLVRALRDTGVERDIAEAACAACGLDPSRRIEGLDAAELVALHAACAAGGLQ